jgi:hypothetical protein
MNYLNLNYSLFFHLNFYVKTLFVQTSGKKVFGVLIPKNGKIILKNFNIIKMVRSKFDSS